MFKSFFNKITNFYNWTKKWHFFHVLFIPTSLFFLCNCILFLLVKYIIKDYSNYQILLITWICFFIIHLIFLLIAIILEVLFAVINWIKYKNIQIRTSFFIKNKIYNFVYLFAFLCNLSYLALTVYIAYCILHAMFMMSYGFSW